MRRPLGHALAAVCLTSAAVTAADPPAARVADFAFMAGCWQGGDAQTTMEETWTRPGGGTMMGTSRVLAGGKAVFSEFVEVAEKPTGLVMTVALGIGEPGVPFTRIAAGPDEVVFENPTHDFPQRIRYRKLSDISVLARIEGVEKGQAKGEDYPFRRIACP
ncbi:MAG TPA: DUF6265 family protein [Vicinamibacteria bacterium]|nr:DUF6265 family protein [Vicinamibacteria bacterium]